MNQNKVLGNIIKSTILIISAVLLNSCEFRTSYAMFQKLQIEDIKTIEFSYFPYQKVEGTNYFKYIHLDTNLKILDYNPKIYCYEMFINSKEIKDNQNIFKEFLEKIKIKTSETNSISSSKKYNYKKGEYVFGKFIICLKLLDSNYVYYIQNDFFPKQSYIMVSNYGYRVLGMAPKGFFEWDFPKPYCFSSEVLENDFKNLYNELAKYQNKQMINSVKPNENRDSLKLYPLIE